MAQCRRCGQAHDPFAACAGIRPGGRAPFPTDDAALVGTLIADRYEVREILGWGMTGTVFGAQHVRFGRGAALKVLRPRYGSPDLASLVFHGEARAAWSVSHPCLCEVFDIGTLPGGTPFFVMEHLEGETLAARVARDRLSLAAAIDMVMQLLSAIAAVHAKDLVLRDLRPQNVFLTHRRGCRPLLKILDFGLARLIPLDRVEKDASAFVDVGAQSGSRSSPIPYYLSPERALGEHAVEPTSDLFVAAVLLYEALAGERPFFASSFEGIRQQIRQGKPVPLHERRSDVPHELSAVVARTLSADPRLRPASAKDMQDEIRAAFEGGKKPSPSVFVSAGSTALPVAPKVSDPPRVEDSTFASMAAPPPTVPLPPTHPHDPLSPASQPKEARAAGSVLSASPHPARGGFDDETRRDDIITETLIKTLQRETTETTIDEASAENTDRTVPPPPPMDAEITVDLAGKTDPTLEVKRKTRAEVEDEETQTNKLTPELRARLEQLLANPSPPPAPRPQSIAPPKPTRR